MVRSAAAAVSLLLLLLTASCGDSAPVPAPADAALAFCADDAECDDGLFCNGVESCDPTDDRAFLSGCVAGTAPCAAGLACDEDSDSCEGECLDADGDGSRDRACGGDDCDDGDASRYPGNAEVCDEADVDEDCDPTTFGSRDVDGDGFVDATCCNGSTCGDDCVDTMGSINTGATETCDGADQDCDGAVDEGLIRPAFRDVDGDLHGDADEAFLSCPGWAHASTTDLDCEDSDPRTHRLQLEVCDGVDNDCDTIIDEETVSLPWYPDSDGDGFGDPSGTPMVACAPPDGHSLLPLDCDDAEAARSPAATELCNGRDDDCDGFANFVIRPGDLEDDDHDGHPDMGCDGGTDCDDRDPFSGPGMYEFCDGIDNDCDGTVDEATAGDPPVWYQDQDGDGVGGALAALSGCERPSGNFALQGGDCSDDDASQGPQRVEVCDGVDQDCDGRIDEGAATSTAYADTDGDGFGAGVGRLACELAAGEVLLPGDCDDSAALVHPGAVEFCNTADDDCDSAVDEMAVVVDWYVDSDGDGHGDPATTPMASCAPIAGRAPNSDDCDDTDGAVSPMGTEACNGEDDDCDGSIDEVVAATYYRDSDGDGAGDDAVTMLVCRSVPVGFVAMGGDCDDTDPTRSPAEAEICDDIDQDCDMAVDEGASVSTCVGPGYSGACSVGGACACDVGLGDCNGNTTDGCESNPMDDPNHCGGCGVACEIGDTCTAGVCDTSPIIEVAAGGTNTCILRANGNIACAGLDGSDTWLSPDAGINHYTPFLVPIQAEHIANAGYDPGGYTAEHRCIIQDSGATIRCWGHRQQGCLGDGPAAALLRGQTALAMTPAGATYSQIGVGSRFSCALRTTGEVDCWGRNLEGQLGVGDRVDRLVPTQVLGFDDATELSVGYWRSCAVRASGSVTCWGNTGPGLGDPGPTPVMDTANDLIDITGAVQVAVSANHACARLSSGLVRCWGSDGLGQLGDGVIGPIRALSGPVSLITDAVDISAGASTTCAVLGDSRVACWGSDNAGEVGNDDAHTVAEPTPLIVVDERGTPILATSVHLSIRNYSCALLLDGGVACWGSNYEGRWGTGSGSSFGYAVRMQLD